MDSSLPFTKSYICLLCGNGSTVLLDGSGYRIRVKREVTENPEETNGNCSREQSKEGVEEEEDDEEDGRAEGANLSWEVRLFQFFAMYINMDFRMSSRQWDYQKEPVPLCEPCKTPLRRMKNLYDDLKKLEALIVDNMKMSEARFKELDLYNSDERYYWCRSRVLGTEVVGTPMQSLKSVQSRRVKRDERRKRKTRSSGRNIYRAESNLMNMPCKEESNELDNVDADDAGSPTPADEHDQDEVASLDDRDQDYVPSPQPVADSPKDNENDTSISTPPSSPSPASPPRPKRRRGRPKRTSAPIKTDFERERIAVITGRTRRAKKRKSQPQTKVKTPAKKKLIYTNLDPTEPSLAPPPPKRKPVPCETCGMPVTRRSNLRLHRITHMSEEERREAEERGEIPKQSEYQQCKTCLRMFSPWRIKQHESFCSRRDRERALNKPATFLCPDCGKSYKTANCLKSHQKLVHPDPDQWGTMKFACVFCDKRFVKEKELKMHKVKHTGDYPFPCSLCERKFATKLNYEQHMRLHTNERPFQCDFCPMAYVSESSLKRHIKTYHEEGSNPKRASFYKDPSRGNFHALKCTVQKPQAGDC